jgi:cobalt-zinc-cadmium efflux system membrane fusion protein
MGGRPLKEHPMTRLWTLVLALSLSGCAGHPPAEQAESAEATPTPGIVTLDAAGAQAVALATTKATSRRLTVRQEVPGAITHRPEAEALVHAPVAGQVVAVHARVGDRVATGAPLLTLRSAERAGAQAEYLKALGQRRLAAKAHARERQLFGAELASRQELDEAAQKLEAAELDVAQAAEGLRVLGYGDDELSALARRNRVAVTHVVRAPRAGTVVARDVAVGEAVAPDHEPPLFRLLDLGTVRVEAELPERELLAVKPGQAAEVALVALDGRAVAGRVVTVSPVLDANTRTGRAAIDVPNPKGQLKPGMSARVRIDAGARAVLALPMAAVQEESGQAYAYVALGDDRYRETALKLGARLDGAIEVLSGIQPGDTVVTQGSFDLRSQARKAQFGGD